MGIASCRLERASPTASEALLRTPSGSRSRSSARPFEPVVRLARVLDRLCASAARPPGQDTCSFMRTLLSRPVLEPALKSALRPLRHQPNLSIALARNPDEVIMKLSVPKLHLPTGWTQNSNSQSPVQQFGAASPTWASSRCQFRSKPIDDPARTVRGTKSHDAGETYSDERYRDDEGYPIALSKGLKKCKED